MDASAIDAPFLLSKISHHNSNSNNNPSGISSSSPTTATGEPPAIPEEGVSPQYGGELGRAPPVPADGTADGPSAFDAVFTNAALHWVRAPRTVIDGAKRVLRPGGRFVGEFGGHGNMAAVRVAMHAALWRRGLDPLEVDPWYFPTAEEYRGLLEAVRVLLQQRGRDAREGTVDVSRCFASLRHPMLCKPWTLRLLFFFVYTWSHYDSAIGGRTTVKGSDRIGSDCCFCYFAGYILWGAMPSCGLESYRVKL